MRSGAWRLTVPVIRVNACRQSLPCNQSGCDYAAIGGCPGDGHVTCYRSCAETRCVASMCFRTQTLTLTFTLTLTLIPILIPILNTYPHNSTHTYPHNRTHTHIHNYTHTRKGPELPVPTEVFRKGSTCVYLHSLLARPASKVLSPSTSTSGCKRFFMRLLCSCKSPAVRWAPAAPTYRCCVCFEQVAFSNHMLYKTTLAEACRHLPDGTLTWCIQDMEGRCTGPALVPARAMHEQEAALRQANGCKCETYTSLRHFDLLDPTLS